MKSKTSKVKVRTGPEDPYYLRLRPRLSLWQRVRLLFGATLTTFVEIDDGAPYVRAQAYLDGKSIGGELVHGTDWEGLAPGGLLSPSQAERFCGLLGEPMDLDPEQQILDAMRTRLGADMDREMGEGSE